MSAPVTDAELSALVAERVAGYYWGTHDKASGTYWLCLPGSFKPEGWTVAKGDTIAAKNKSYLNVPPYAKSCDAVLSLLERSTAFCSLEFVSGNQWTCALTYASPKPEGCESFEATDTLPRAICLALLLAARTPAEMARENGGRTRA